MTKSLLDHLVYHGTLYLGNFLGMLGGLRPDHTIVLEHIRTSELAQEVSTTSNGIRPSSKIVLLSHLLSQFTMFAFVHSVLVRGVARDQFSIGVDD